MGSVSSQEQRREWISSHPKLAATLIGASWGLLCTLGSAVFAGWQALASGVVWVPAGVLFFGPMFTKRMVADNFGKPSV